MHLCCRFSYIYIMYIIGGGSDGRYNNIHYIVEHNGTNQNATLIAVTV